MPVADDVAAVGDAAEKGSKAIERLSAPNVFASALVFVLLIGFFGCLYLFRSDWRDERVAQQRLYTAMIDRMDDIHDHLIDLGAQKTEHDKRVESTARRAKVAHDE